jgi:hypothetical protein
MRKHLVLVGILSLALAVFAQQQKPETCVTFLAAASTSTAQYLVAPPKPHEMGALCEGSDQNICRVSVEAIRECLAISSGDQLLGLLPGFNGKIDDRTSESYQEDVSPFWLIAATAHHADEREYRIVKWLLVAVEWVLIFAGIVLLVAGLYLLEYRFGWGCAFACVGLLLLAAWRWLLVHG